MREISLMAATALITALITGMPAKTTAASTSMNIMQMMRDAKNLPEQSYDAH